MLFNCHLLYFCTALSLIIMLSSHYHLHKSKTLSQLTQCPFTGTLLLFLFIYFFLFIYLFFFFDKPNAKMNLFRKRMHDCVISIIFFTLHPGYLKSHLSLFAKNRFLPFLPAILNLCVKCKSAFISGIVCDRVILTIFLTPGYMQSSGTFCQKSFSAIFGSYVEFLCKAQKMHLSQKLC